MAVTPEEQKNARRKAMLLLEHMDRTEKGLSDRLRQAGFSALRCNRRGERRRSSDRTWKGGPETNRAIMVNRYG